MGLLGGRFLVGQFIGKGGCAGVSVILVGGRRRRAHFHAARIRSRVVGRRLVISCFRLRKRGRLASKPAQGRRHRFLPLAAVRVVPIPLLIFGVDHPPCAILVLHHRFIKQAAIFIKADFAAVESVGPGRRLILHSDKRLGGLKEMGGRRRVKLKVFGTGQGWVFRL